MSTEGSSFAAEILKRSASGWAGFAASAMLDEDPALEKRYAPDAFASWKSHLTQRILELAAALETGEPALFASRVAWTRKTFAARGQPDGDLRTCLAQLKKVLVEHLPDTAGEPAVSLVDEALASLETKPPAPEPSELDPKSPTDRLALAYLQSILEGNGSRAIADVLAAAKKDRSAIEVYTTVLLPAQREIGRLWSMGEMNAAGEHLVSSVTQRAMAVLVQSARPARINGKTVVAAAVAGNAHELGLRAVSDAFEMSGWRSIFLGSNLPAEDLPGTLDYFEADLLLLTATLGTQLPTVRRTIERVRAHVKREVKILVGGGAFDELPGVWKKVGADGYAPTIEEALILGAKLVGL